MEFLDYIDIKGISTNVITYIILGFIAIIVVFFREKIFRFNKKPESNPQDTPRDEPAKGKTTNEDDSFATNETDYQRKILLLNKLKELEPLIKEFKDILKKTPVSAIRAEPPTETGRQLDE